jgi:hypothetical protein
MHEINSSHHRRHRDSRLSTEQRYKPVQRPPSVPTKPPEPTPLQCTKCYQLGHPATACTNKPACPKCPETHAPNNCEAATPKCLLCGGAHAAWSRKCPKFKDTLITDETPIAPTYIITPPPAEFADPEVLINESAEFKINTKQTVVFVTKILYDLFPLQRPKIHELVELASRQILRTCDGKKFWNKFKVITGQKRKTNHYLATDAHIYYTPQERANCFAELLDGIHQGPNDPNFNATFFDQIANNVHAFKNIPLIDPLPHPLDDEHLTDNITTDEVKTIISLLKNTKAPGPDQIRPILLKNLPDSAFQARTDIFNNCMNNLYFPTAWKTAHTVMIPKPGKCPNDPKSYRPISLLSITGKIFERILTNRLQFTLESNNLLPPEQFGFRAQRSTHNPLAELQTGITRHANLGECTVGVFLDIEKHSTRSGTTDSYRNS